MPHGAAWREESRHDRKEQTALPDQRRRGDAETASPDAPDVREERADPPEPDGGTDAHVLTGGRRRDRQGDTPGARPWRESGRHRNHPKDETPDARHASSDRALDGIRASRPGSVGGRGSTWKGRSAGASGVEPTGTGRPILSRQSGRKGHEVHG